MAASPSTRPGFAGKRVLTEKGEKGDANEAVIKALIDAGMLIARGRFKHQYPHSWRSKKPVIFRNTPQWFIAMDNMMDEPGHLGSGSEHYCLKAIGSDPQIRSTRTPSSISEDRPRFGEPYPAPVARLMRSETRAGCRSRAKIASPAWSSRGPTG